MIIDRISLNLALKYLIRIEENEGKVTDILFTSRDQAGDTSKSAKFPDIATLVVFLNTYAPLTGFNNIDCVISRMFELRAFNFTKGPAEKNKVYMDGSTFKTISKNMNSISLTNLNTEYIPLMNEVKGVFGDAAISEYILEQYKYIDCGYIAIYEPEVIDAIEALYNKYKQL